MPEIAKSPVAEMRDLREALRSSERVFFGGKPYRDAFCDIYDYAAELETAIDGPSKRSAKANHIRVDARLLLYALDVGDDEGFAFVRKRLERRIGYSAWAGLRASQTPA